MLIYPYMPYSQSARALSQALSARRIKHQSSTFRGSPHKTVINWGSSHISNREVFRCRLLNNPVSVAQAVNKLAFFNQVPSDLVPPFTTSKEVAQQWPKTVCRTILNGHSGQGIVIANPETLVDAPLYTKYIPKTTEWRVHILNGSPIDVQRKARSRDLSDEDINWDVRSHANGFIYARGDLSDWSDTFKDSLYNVATKVVSSLGLDFGAVDIIQHHDYGMYALECNTAPGLTGTTLSKYVEAFNGTSSQR